MKKILTECPKKKRKSCKGCKSCNRCRLRRVKFLWQRWCYVITLVVAFTFMVAEMLMVADVKQTKMAQEERSKEFQAELENYKVSEANARNLIKKIEPITIIEAQPLVASDVEMETATVVAEVEEKETVATISAYGPGDAYFYWVSDEDYLNLKKVVYQEARGEAFEGQVAVAAVVLNRYASGDYSKFNCSSVTSVIVQSGQFAPISDVTEEQLKAYPEVTEAVQEALKGYDPTRLGFENGATFFYQPETTYGTEYDRRQGVESYRIGNHVFHNDFAF